MTCIQKKNKRNTKPKIHKQHTKMINENQKFQTKKTHKNRNNFLIFLYAFYFCMIYLFFLFFFLLFYFFLITVILINPTYNYKSVRRILHCNFHHLLLSRSNCNSLSYSNRNHSYICFGSTLILHHCHRKNHKIDNQSHYLRNIHHTLYHSYHHYIYYLHS